MIQSLSTIEILVGIVTGLVAATLGVLSYRRGRTGCRVEWSTLVFNNDQYLQIAVTNIGAGDITLTDCGFAVVPEALSERGIAGLFATLIGQRKRQKRAARRYSHLGVNIDDEGEEHEELVLLKPTERRVFKISMSYVVGWLGSDEVAWPYVRDTFRQDIYSRRPLHARRQS